MSILKKIKDTKNTQKNIFRSPFSFDEAEAEEIEKEEISEDIGELPQIKPAKPHKRRRKNFGRPKIPKEERLVKNISVVVTDAENKKIEKLAKKSGLSKSNFVRRIILDSIK